MFDTFPRESAWSSWKYNRTCAKKTKHSTIKLLTSNTHRGQNQHTTLFFQLYPYPNTDQYIILKKINIIKKAIYIFISFHHFCFFVFWMPLFLLTCCCTNKKGLTWHRTYDQPTYIHLTRFQPHSTQMQSRFFPFKFFMS